MAKTADVVVIGGGVNGSSIAFHLAKRKVGRIVLVERRFIAGGPTGRSSGIVRTHYTLETLARMALDSVKVFQNFKEEVGGDAGFAQTGAAFIMSQGNLETLKKTVEMHHRVGINATLLSPEDLKKLEPHLYIDDLAGGAYEPESGYADPALTANSFAEAAQGLGVELMQRTRVTGLLLDESSIQGVVTDKGEIEAPIVINAAGPWGSEIASMAGAEVPIVPSRHTVVLVQRPPQWREPVAVWGDLVHAAYYKPEGHRGGLLLGSISPEDAEKRADPETASEAADYDVVSLLTEMVMKRFPVMSDAMVQGGWAGLYDVTPDWQPVIDEIPEAKGFYCAVGFSGHGFKLAPAVGRIVSELVVEGKCHSYDISVFRYSRFAEGRLSRGEYEYSILG